MHDRSCEVEGNTSVVVMDTGNADLQTAPKIRFNERLSALAVQLKSSGRRRRDRRSDVCGGV